MDSSTNIIAIVLFLLFSIPFLLMNFSAKKRKKENLTSLFQLASLYQCKINQHEVKDDIIIALDSIHKHAFFYKKGVDIDIEEVVNLEEVEDCKVVKKYDDKQNKIEKLDLIFSPKNKSKSVVAFDFFDININKQLTGELQLAEKWSRLINDQIKNKNS